VTIVIVGIALVYVMQGLNTSKLTAALTRNQKVARDLGLFTLGQIESGLLRDDIDTGMSGNYSEEGYPDFNWEIAVGDDTLPETQKADSYGKPHDSWAPTRAELDAKAEEDEEDAEEPYEKVRVRVTFPQIREYANEVTLERWIAWKQVYGEAESEVGSDNANASKNKKASKGSGTDPAASKGAPPTESKP
jgi:hypothetical protein